MLIDSRELPNQHVIEADVVIIGGGAAGISLGCELIDKGLDVALLESGGLEPDAQAQSLNNGESIGQASPPLAAARLRFFGGTTNHWTGQCAPLDPIDFEERDWVPDSGWPMTRADLDPYYARATEYCQLGPYEDFDPSALMAALGYPDFDGGQSELETTMYMMSRSLRFSEAWRSRLEDANNVTVYLHANVIEVMPNEAASQVRELRCGTLAGQRFTARARAYVLAAGGIENARLLLASRSVVPAGVGNTRDLVGRYFMDHMNVLTPGRITFGRPEETDLSFFVHWAHGPETRGLGALRLPPETLRSERMLNAGIILTPELANENYQDPPRTPAVDAFSNITRALASGRFPPELLDGTCLIAADAPSVATFVKRRVMRSMLDSGGTVSANLQVEAEQSPNPNSRVTLSDEVDAFGVPRPVLDWQILERDFTSIRRTQELIGLAVGSTGLGRLQVDPPIDSGSPPEVSTAWHHMGTTRMATSSERGVVDPDCRLFGVDNLYVAGSSVFPTGGRSNPTLTIVALTIRLGDLLTRSLRG